MAKKHAKRARRKKMTEPAEPTPEVVKAKEDVKNQVTLNILRPPDGQILEIQIKAPVVASVIRSMAMSNYPFDKYEPIYRPILAFVKNKDGQEVKTHVVTRAAIAKATRNFVGGTDFSFKEPPRAILLANPVALEEGYTLTFKVDEPVPPDQLRKWGKQFMDGCADIIANARPFRMSWVMDEVKK